MAPPGSSKGLLPLVLPLGHPIRRVHRQGNGPVFFGPAAGHPPANRFDAPAGEFCVLYAAEELTGAFVETVLRRPGRILRRGDVYQRCVTTLEVGRDLTLAKVYDEGLRWYGVHAGTIGVDDYAPSRQLALDLYTGFPNLDGLAYRSRFNNGQICYALFDRVLASELTPRTTARFEDHATVVDRLMALHGAAFDTSSPP